jgi:peptide/nickel transport system substrate-binding protein
VQPNPGGVWIAPDLERARALVATSHTAGTPIAVWMPTSLASVGEYVVRVLNDLGYRAQLNVAPFGDFYDKVMDSRNKVQLAGYWWAADYPAASNVLDILFSCRAFVESNTQNMNMAEFCEPGLDSRMAAALAAQTTDPGHAVDQWQSIDRGLVDQAPCAALATFRGLDVLAPRVGNYQQHPEWLLLIDQLWVK